MDDFLVKNKLLTEILLRKEQMLEEILNITFNQRLLIESSKKNESNLKNKESIALYGEMNRLKQDIMAKIMAADEIFQSTFNTISKIFEKQAKENRNEVKSMQNKIKQVTNLDFRVKAEEEKNRMLLNENKKEEVRTKKGERLICSFSKASLLKKYRDNYLLFQNGGLRQPQS